MKNSLFCILFFFPLFAGESYRSYKKKEKAENTLEVIKIYKEHFAQRAQRLKDFDGTVVKLKYKYFNELSAKEAKFQKKFLAGRFTKKELSKHERAYIKDLPHNLQKLKEAEKTARKKWKAPPKEMEVADEVIVGEVYFQEISSEKLGVILDSSYSMKPYLKKLRKEIKKDFPNAVFYEVDSSFLEQHRDFRTNSRIHFSWYYTKPNKKHNPFHSIYNCQILPRAGGLYWQLNRWKRDNFSAIKALVDGDKVDTIYWFCDMDDKIDKKAVKELEKLLLKKKITLYIHTLKKRPPRALKNLVKQTSGKVIKKKIR